MRRAIGQCLHGQLDAALVVGFEHLDAHDLAFGQEVGDLFNALVRNLADVQQTVLARQQVDQSAEVQDLGDRAFVDLADLDLSRDLLDATLGFVSLGASRCEHCNAHALAGTGRQHGGTAHLLVGLLGVHT